MFCAVKMPTISYKTSKCLCNPDHLARWRTQLGTLLCSSDKTFLPHAQACCRFLHSLHKYPHATCSNLVICQKLHDNSSISIDQLALHACERASSSLMLYNLCYLMQCNTSHSIAHGLYECNAECRACISCGLPKVDAATVQLMFNSRAGTCKQSHFYLVLLHAACRCSCIR